MYAAHQLSKELIMHGVLKTHRLIDAFMEVDRKRFVPRIYADIAYDDKPLPIGFGATISQPTTVAFMLELLHPKPGEHVLDIGAGSGWTTALLAYAVGEEGTVIGTEAVPELVDIARRHTKHLTNARIILSKDGFAMGAPYDRILVSASANDIPPHFVKQLAIGGVMVIPIGTTLFRITRTDERSVESEEYPGFSFVPLVL